MIFASDGFNQAPIAWSSHRLKRVSRSTLTAETLALVDGIDHAIYLSQILSTIIFNGCQNIKIQCFTDNKSLLEASSTSNVTDEKRLRIEMAYIREVKENKLISLSWVSTDEQLADCLTKAGASKNLLRTIIAKGQSRI